MNQEDSMKGPALQASTNSCSPNSNDSQPVSPAASNSLGAASVEETPPPQYGHQSAVVIERNNFLLFIKILFKTLEQSQEPETRSKAQRIVLECKRRSKQGDPKFNPLMEACERRLRVFVGEAVWRRAHLFLHHAITRGHSTPLVATMRKRPTAVLAGK